MGSLKTNTPAMTALRALTETQKALTGVQSQITTGLRVADASDNAAYWSISTAMKSQLGAIGAVQDALNLTKSIADVTSTALKSVIASTQKIQQNLVTAQTPGLDLSQVQTDIAAQQNAIRQTALSASFNGVNWLVGSDSFVTTINETENYDTDYATYQSILNHTSSPSTESIATVNHTTTTNKNDGNGNVSTTQNIYSGTVRFYNVYYSQANITRTQTGGLLPDYTQMPTSISSGATSLSRVQTSDMQLFTSSSNSITVNHTATWTDRSISDNDTDVFTGIQDTVPAGAGIFADTFSSSSGQMTLLGMNIASFSQADFKSASNAVATALTKLTGAAASVANVQNRVAIQAQFNSALSDAITSGVGSLIDADMSVASTRLQALQTQQQLGIQALSIANDNSKAILKLFG